MSRMQTVFLPLDGACNGNVLQEGGALRVDVEAVVLRARAGLGVAASLTAIQALGGARKSAKTEAALVTGDPTQMSLSRALPLMQRSLRMASLQLRLWRLLAKQKQPQRLSPRSPC